MVGKEHTQEGYVMKLILGSPTLGFEVTELEADVYLSSTLLDGPSVVAEAYAKQLEQWAVMLRRAYPDPGRSTND
jgi:hypothetical protein